MCSVVPTPPRALSRGPLHQDEVRASLSEGRHADALEALRQLRRSRLGAEAVSLALQEAEALFGLLRFRDALGVATRALRRRPVDPDVAARLRVVRGHALWLTGRVRPGRAEVLRGIAGAREPLTRARGCEALALFAWKEQDLDGARRHLSAARALYEEAGSAEGLVRVLEKEARVLRDAGRIEAALDVLARRIEAAAASPRLDALASARTDRGDLLGVLGRWREAREELDEASRLFREVGDPREMTLAGVNRAVLDVAEGDLVAAQAALARARGALGAGGDPRAAAEIELLVSDVHLAAGEPEGAEQAAVEALKLFGLVRDRVGESRARFRRSHALLGLSRLREALREARRSLRAAPSSRGDLQALAALAMGRVLLRGRRADAGAAFERAIALCGFPSGILHAARLGRAIAAGVRRGDEEVERIVRSLEIWGDRRLLSLCLGDVACLLGPEGGPRARATVRAVPDHRSDALVEAAVALTADGEWSALWAAAVRAVEPLLPWSRAVLVDEPAWELRSGSAAPGLAPEADLAREIVRTCRGPARLDLRRDPAWRRHPQRVLHRLGEALVVPAGEGGAFYLERRDGAPGFGEGDLVLAAHLGRLLGGRRPACVAAEPPDARAAFPGIVGRCSGMALLFDQMSRVAASEVTVHVSGETGTGKERVARALHERSARRARPFVALNASSLSDELFEAEMFGHTRGAFTGAVAPREGHVAEAEGGTLFLDEVADLTPRGQAKLLRFLGDFECRRLGESVTRRADVRVLTAANADLRERVRAGAFREDLMYRLTPLTLSLPPLRERGGDILLLARHFLREAAASEGRPAPVLSSEAGRALEGYAWPGNIRELENEMKRLVVLGGRGPMRCQHLSPRIAAAMETPRGSGPLREAVAAFEREHIVRALGVNGGNRARTALALGLTRQALLGKMKRLGV
ncbi:MAG: sigma-54-dependent Fis family transcriptional regulator [Acidobacteria bacterium]|nr:sigma-54-dependent Fis family transcriptional regulator [Acidobacteriota bacterium]